MTKLIGGACVFLFLLGGFIGGSLTSEATGIETFGLHIIKYRLESDTKLSQDLPLGGAEVEEVMDEAGNFLEPLPDVTYYVTKVTLNEEERDRAASTSYIPVAGFEAFTKTLVTNSQGVAEINGLTKGTYLVEELPNQTLKIPMIPVVVTLPFPTVNGPLADVYLYPKSSVITESPTSKIQNTGTSKLPQTSGTIGSIHQMIFMLGLIVAMGILGLTASRRKRS